MTARLALVTGASSGLGRAAAADLGRRGCRVVLLARDESRLEEARREVERAGGSVIAGRADVRDSDQLNSMLAATTGGAPLDLLVHAAGVLSLGPLETLGEAALREMLDVNVVGAACVVRAALPQLAAARGRVALVASIAGRMALPGGFTGYAASKWALRGWAECARPELLARGVSLTVAYPSIVDTSMISAQRGPEAPSVYRTFPWHAPELVARRVVDDALRGRRESFVSFGDRAASWAAGAAPFAFHAALRALLRARAR